MEKVCLGFLEWKITRHFVSFDAEASSFGEETN
jgi:hypothetical protein